jgi:hypothetical protein
MTTNTLLSTSPFPTAATFERRPGAAAIRTDRIYILYTGVEQTLAAARVAGPFAEALGIPLTVVHFRTVPYPLPLDGPAGISPIETAEFLRRLRGYGFDAQIRVFLCRDDQQVMPRALNPHSLVVLAGRRSWWPTRVERSRRTLEAAGHFVVFVDAAYVQEHADAA